MITYWSPGRCFGEEHGRALRYHDESLTNKRMREPNFPKDSAIESTWCNECGVWHITRQSKLPLNIR